MLSLGKVEVKQSYIDKLDWWSKKGIEGYCSWLVVDYDGYGYGLESSGSSCSSESNREG